MKYRRRIYYSAAQRAEIWDRWQRGESMSSIGRRFDRESSSVFSVISPTGGIRPTDRKRGRLSLSPSEREEISRGLSVQHSLRMIARQLGRAPSTISREVRRNGGPERYRAQRVLDAEPSRYLFSLAETEGQPAARPIRRANAARRRDHRKDRRRLPVKPPPNRTHRLSALPAIPDLSPLHG